MYFKINDAKTTLLFITTSNDNNENNDNNNDNCDLTIASKSLQLDP